MSMGNPFRIFFQPESSINSIRSKISGRPMKSIPNYQKSLKRLEYPGTLAWEVSLLPIGRSSALCKKLSPNLKEPMMPFRKRWSPFLGHGPKRDKLLRRREEGKEWIGRAHV